MWSILYAYSDRRAEQERRFKRNRIWKIINDDIISLFKQKFLAANKTNKIKKWIVLFQSFFRNEMIILKMSRRIKQDTNEKIVISLIRLKILKYFRKFFLFLTMISITNKIRIIKLVVVSATLKIVLIICIEEFSALLIFGVSGELWCPGALLKKNHFINWFYKKNIP